MHRIHKIIPIWKVSSSLSSNNTEQLSSLLLSFIIIIAHKILHLVSFWTIIVHFRIANIKRTMRIINPSLNPTLFVAFIVAVMIGTLVNISAKEYNARRHAYHHHQSAKQSGGSDAVSFLATTKKRRGMGASGLGDTPLWVCPNNGVCSNHSSVSNAAKNIGVCQDSRGNSIQPTRYCWVPTPGSPTPTVQNPSCECSWPSGTSGCVVSSPAPSFYACKCSLGNKVGTCTAIALPCYDATNYQVSH